MLGWASELSESQGTQAAINPLDDPRDIYHPIMTT